MTDQCKNTPLFGEFETPSRCPNLMTTRAQLPKSSLKWKVMVIDDDPDSHTLLKIILKDFSFEGQGLELIHGYSGADARHMMQNHPDTAILVLDVVMETDHEGLDVVSYLRDELNNRFVRIILRTGQPGQAPEASVVANYDINDYKDKVNLTGQALITSITACLRSYRDLRTIETMRLGLTRIIDATCCLFEPSSLGQLTNGILTQLAALVCYDENTSMDDATGCFAASNKRGSLSIYAAIGCFKHLAGQPLEQVVTEEVYDLIQQAVTKRKSIFQVNHFVGYFKSKGGMENLIYLKGLKPLNFLDQQLITLFSSNIAVAFEQLFLHRELVNTQKDVTFALGEVIEARSGETGQHVRRVSESSRLLATLAGLSPKEVELLWIASPMHDLGKVGIPDDILNKPGALTPQEWEVMKSHTNIGCKVLSGSDRQVLSTGSVICSQHHERWDGKGYPQGLVGEEIHIFARITSLIDVFDALTHNRCYKNAWSIERTVEYIRDESGKQFDPALVTIFLDHLDEFLEIQSAMLDSHKRTAPSDVDE